MRSRTWNRPRDQMRTLEICLAALLGLSISSGCGTGSAQERQVSMAGSDQPTLPAEPVGSEAPEWEDLQWIQGGPLTLEKLRGKVVLVRWWTAPGCPFCTATAPALQELKKDFGDKGLVIVALYHDKSREPVREKDVREYARQMNLDFPMAIDTGWRNLNRWWLDAARRKYTSVSFLIDQEGVIRLVHAGGAFTVQDNTQFPDAQSDYQRLHESITTLLDQGPAERTGGPLLRLSGKPGDAFDYRFSMDMTGTDGSGPGLRNDLHMRLTLSAAERHGMTWEWAIIDPPDAGQLTVETDTRGRVLGATRSDGRTVSLSTQQAYMPSGIVLPEAPVVQGSQWEHVFEYDGWRQKAHYRLVGAELVDGVECVKVEITWKAEGSPGVEAIKSSGTAWVDAKTGWLVKLTGSAQVGQSVTETSITRIK